MMEIYVNSEETLLQNIKQIKSAQKTLDSYNKKVNDVTYDKLISAKNFLFLNDVLDKVLTGKKNQSFQECSFFMY